MQESFVNDRLTAVLKRQCAATFGSAGTLGLLVLTAFFAGLAGPFGTYDAFAPLERHLYWLLVVAGTAVAGHFAGTSTEVLLARRGLPLRLRLPIAAAVAAMPVYCIVVAILLAFGSRPGVSGLLVVFAQCAAVTMGIALLPSFLAGNAKRPRSPVAPKLMRRLPPARRGRLIRLAAQDHYVEVVTARGSTLVAMRFRDAIAEAAPEAGAQTHRSHWVARHAVCGRGRMDGKPVLLLSEGSKVPVGRTFRTAVRNAGLA